MVSNSQRKKINPKNSGERSQLLALRDYKEKENSV